MHDRKNEKKGGMKKVMEAEEYVSVRTRGEGEFILTLHLGFHNHKMCLKNNRQ